LLCCAGPGTRVTMKLRCPTCGTRFDRTDSAYAPFCSERCKLLDLGNWLDERYRIEGEAATSTDDGSESEEIGQD